MSDQLEENIDKPKTIQQKLLSLSPKERAFFLKYIECSNLTESYKSVAPKDENGKIKSSHASCIRSGWKMWDKIKKIVGDQETLMEAHNLGINRLFNEINNRLTAMTAETYEGIVCAAVEDNKTRMAATALLAKIHNLEKQTEGSNIKIIISREPTNEIQVVDE